MKIVQNIRLIFIAGILACFLLSSCGADNSDAPMLVAEWPTETPGPTATLAPPTPIPSPTTSPTAYLGGWQIVRVQAGPVSAMTQSDADKWVGQSAWLADDSIYLGNLMCLRPNYTTEQMDLDTYLADYKESADGFGLTNRQVTKVKTKCANPPLTDFVVLSGNQMLLQQDGWFFIMEPQIQNENGGVVVSPVIDRQSAENPHVDIYIVRPRTDQDQVNQAIAAVIQNQLDGFLRDMSTWEVPAEMKDQASEFDVNYQVMQDSDGKLSILFTRFNFYAGSAHPNTQFFVLNYDLNAGKQLTLSDLFAPGSDYLSRLSAAARKQLTSGDFPLFDEGLEPVDSNFSNWNLQDKNLVISFDQEQIAPHAAGTLSATIPLTDLEDILK
jgi:hypothetical protein